MPGGYDGSIRIDTRVNSKGFNTGIKGIVASLGKVGMAVGIAFGVGAIVNFGRTAVQAASQMASAMTGLQSILDGQGRSFAAAQKFIEDYTADGLVPAMNAIVAYKNLALRGYDDTQIQDIMARLKDSAAFARTSSYTMGEAIQMASEGLKNENSILVDNAGVTKNVSMMWKDYAASIGTSVGTLTLAQKRQAEYNGIMEETRLQVGDAAKLSGGYAGMVAALGTSFLNLKVAIGNAIIPILAQIIPYVKAVVDWFVILFNTIARVINLFFGTSVSMADLETSSDDTADNLGGAADSADDLADNTSKAGKAAKGALAAFDELNVLQMETADASSDTNTGITLPTSEQEGDDDPASGLLDPWLAKIDAFKAKLMLLLEPAIEAFGRLKEALIPLGETIWSGLKWAWDNILVPLGEWVITEALPAFLDLLAGAATVLNSALVVLKPLGIWLFETFLKPAAEWVGDAIIDGLKWLTEGLYALSDWILENQAIVQQMVLIFIAWQVAMFLVAHPIILVVLAIVALIAAIVWLVKNWDKVKEKAGEVWDKIKETWNKAGTWFKDEVTDPVAKWFKNAWEDIEGFFSGAWSAIVKAWEGAPEWFQTTIITPVTEWFETAWEDIEGFFTDTWANVQKIWGEAATWFQDTIIDPIKDGWDEFTEDLGEAWETVWEGVKEIVKGAINVVIGFINSMISSIIGGINAVIIALNSFHIEIPDWVPEYGGESWGINLKTIPVPQIPLLATGAVIPPNAEFLAMLGDQRNGRNIEAPEALIRQIVREEVGNQQTDISVRFEGTLGALVRELKPVIDRETTRIGRSLVTGGSV